MSAPTDQTDNPTPNPVDDPRLRERRLLIWAAVIALGIYLWYGLVYLDGLGTGLGMNDVARRNVGFEGISALINGLAFAAFYFAVRLQREDLRTTHQEMRLTRDELVKTREAQEAIEEQQREMLALSRRQARINATPSFGVQLHIGRDVLEKETGETVIILINQGPDVTEGYVYIATGHGTEATVSYFGLWAELEHKRIEIPEAVHQCEVVVTYTIATGERLATWYHLTSTGKPRKHYHDVIPEGISPEAWARQLVGS